MKCKTCGAKASVNMRQHKLALCSEHYLQWLPDQTQRFIEKYSMFSRQERILVAVSGGKDSLSLWDILNRLGYAADGLYIGLGIDGGVGYSAESRGYAQRFADSRGLQLHVVEMSEAHGHSIPELAQSNRRGQGRPCSVCGLSKRHVLNGAARDLGYNVLATGHNLDDEAAVLFGNTLQWSVDFMRRQGPVLSAESGFVRKVKPLCRFYEREMAAYALLSGIEYIYDECPHSVGSTSLYYKDLLNQLETDRPGAKLAFYLRFLEAKATGSFSVPAEPGLTLFACVRCGQPTSNEGLCSFCRMIAKADQPGIEASVA